MTIQAELKRLGTELSKATDIRAIELNPTLSPATADRMIREIADHAKKSMRTQRVSLVCYTGKQ